MSRQRRIFQNVSLIHPFAAYYDALAAKLVNVSDLSVRQFSQGLIDMAKDSTGLADNLLYRLLFTRQLLESHAHKAALPAYFDVS